VGDMWESGSASAEGCTKGQRRSLRRINRMTKGSPAEAGLEVEDSELA